MRGFIRFFAVFILLTSGVTAQSSGYFGKTIVREGRDFSFPVFFSKNDKKVVTKINRLLQLSELYYLAKPPYSSAIFNQSKANDGSIYGGKAGLETTIHSNNSRVVSLGIVQSACGATCGYWNTYYSFNAGNGDRIDLKDLFTETGYEKFVKIVLMKRSVKYRREVKKKVEPEDQESFLGTLSCFEYDNLSDFYIRNNTIFIDGDSCLVKAQKFEGLDMVVRFNLPTFKQYLSDYGKCVFGVNKRDISKFRSRQLPQLFEGTVDGSLPIVMILKPDFEKSYWGMYAYLKFGEGISLRGSKGKNENELEMTEYILSPTVTSGPLGEIRKSLENGSLLGRLSGQTFEGFWLDKDKLKRLPFFVSVN